MRPTMFIFNPADLRKEIIMYSLFVSFDVGLSYQKFMESDNTKELEDCTMKEDINWCRWYIEEDGKMVYEIVCPIHKDILYTLDRLNR